MDVRVLEAVRPLTTCLEEMGVLYEISGSIASSVHGVPRSSIDADILAALDAPQVPALARRLEGRYYLSEARMDDAVRRGASFNLIHLDTMLKVDVFVSRDRPFDRRAFDRARPVSIEGQATVAVSSAEDVVLAKLEWYRKGGELSERQWADVIGVLHATGSALDLPYLRHGAVELGILDLLARALGEAKRNAGSP
jgi:hypothetical protein